jgi:hypothetical protein
MLGHNSAGEWAAHRLPGGLHLPTQRETQQSPQLRVLRLEHRAEQRREELLEQRLEQLRVELREQRAVQPRIQVEIQLRIQVGTHVLTQANTQLAKLRPILPDVLRGILREIQPRLRRAVPAFVGSASHQGMRGECPFGLGGAGGSVCGGLVRFRAAALLQFGFEAAVGGTVVLAAFQRGRQVLLFDLRVLEVVGVFVPFAVAQTFHQPGGRVA